MKILFIGDISGRPGREMLEKTLAKIEQDEQINFTIVNAENASGGHGMRRDSYNLFRDLGVDALTMGNHVWDNRDIFDLMVHNDNIVVPANLSCKRKNAQGYHIFETKNGEKICVINLLGRVYMNPMPGADCPFLAVDEILKSLPEEVKIIIVDLHCEATSEKISMGHFLTGRVSAVLGTHTHVQTNDDRILAGKTAYITDVGMTGVKDSCLGMAVEPIVERFVTGLPTKMTIAAGEKMINGVVIDVDSNGKAKSIKKINICEYDM